MKTKLLFLLAAIVATNAVAGDHEEGQRAIRDRDGKIVAYKERTANGERYRDADQKIILTVPKNEKHPEPKK